MLHKVEPSSTFCNIQLEFAARQVEHAVVILATTRSICNATMLRDKLNKNAARITGPLKKLVRTEVRIFAEFACRFPLHIFFFQK